ncbi:zinc transporter ZIP11 [Anguilla rostrata]|uniref:zinc transporter ZIP11 n=1 Tax=Anguilla rostrata TaxID=7938 RepID=UPI0030D3EDE9
MIAGYSPMVQALLGTLFTWGLTAAGAALVFVFSSGQKRILDGSLGFAAGVMLAASYWSLLAPAIDMAEDSGKYGAFAFLPVAVGFTLGAAFVYAADLAMPLLGVGDDPHKALALPVDSRPPKEKEEDSPPQLTDPQELAIRIDKIENGEVYQRRRGPPSGPVEEQGGARGPQEGAGRTGSSWRRIVLLILAITIHNIPEGLAVGVGFGAVGKTPSATFESARFLRYGQLSGMVEPIAGLIGAVAVVMAEPLLPYALAFAAGAMVYVVVDDIIPEAQVSGNGKLASWTSILGFVVMMSLDVGLG